MNALPTPGVSLAKLTTILSEQSANIIEVNHERLCRWLSAKAAVLAIMIELADAASDDRLISAFFLTQALTQNQVIRTAPGVLGAGHFAPQGFRVVQTPRVCFLVLIVADSRKPQPTAEQLRIKQYQRLREHARRLRFSTAHFVMRGQPLVQSSRPISKTLRELMSSLSLSRGRFASTA